MAHSQAVEPTRRDFLYIATGTFGGVGAALAAWPFISQMNPSAAVLALATVEVDISSVQPGQSITVMWRGKPVFIRRRTPKEIQESETVPVSELIDPVARNANFPADAEATDANRLTPKVGGGGGKTETPPANAPAQNGAAPTAAQSTNTPAAAPNAGQPAAAPAASPNAAQPSPAPANAPSNTSAPSATPSPAPAQANNATPAPSAGPAPTTNVPAAQQASPMAGEPPPTTEAAKSEATQGQAAAEKPEWLVVVGVCTHLGCIPLGYQGAYGGWLCPCHGSQYDTAGRVRRGPAPENLAVPPYAFLTNTRIRIG